MDWSMLTSGGAGTLAAGLLIAGAVAGLAAGSLGIGGGFVLMPALYLAMSEMAMPDAVRLPISVATALAACVPSALTLLNEARRKGDFDVEAFRRGALSGVLAAIAGGLAVCFAPGAAVLVVFVSISVALTVWLLFARDGWLRPAPHTGWRWQLLLAAFSGVGTFSGAGAGFPICAYMSGCGTPRTKVVATAMAFEAAFAAVGTIVLILGGLQVADLPPNSLGFVNLASFAVAAPAMFLSATFVPGLNTTSRAGALRKIYALFVVLTVGRMTLLWLSGHGF